MNSPDALDGMLRQVRCVEASLAILKRLRREAPDTFAHYEQDPVREGHIDLSSHRFVLTNEVPDTIELTLQIPVEEDPQSLSPEVLAKEAALQLRCLGQRPGYLTLQFYRHQ